MYSIQEYYFNNDADLNASILNRQNGKLLETGNHPDLNIPYAKIEWITPEDMILWVNKNEQYFKKD
jgi:hypothetical protein